MIITCDNCKKKFNIDSILIPEKGRLLECNSCNHRWFFKKEIINETLTTKNPNKYEKKTIVPIDEVEPIEIEKSETIELLDKTIKDNFVVEESSMKKKNKDDVSAGFQARKSKKKNNILNFIIIFIISFIALVIILDTFQVLISNIVPNIEFLLYNLYETIYDVGLFFKDLI
tara:strand:- start:441 stop:956 length:516 start_codon:yes stop_codon:yes gene_type:complete